MCVNKMSESIDIYFPGRWDTLVRCLRAKSLNAADWRKPVGEAESVRVDESSDGHQPLGAGMTTGPSARVVNAGASEIRSS